MKTYNRYKLSGEITEESVWECLNWLDYLDNEGILYAKLYINSEGGDADASSVLIEALNERPYVDVVALGMVCSAGFMIFTECNNYKSLSKYFRFGMIHKIDNRVSLSSIKHPEPRFPGRIVFDQYEEVSNLDYDFIKSLLTKEELERYNNADDVNLGRGRMTEITNLLNKKNIECQKVRDTLREEQDRRIEQLKESLNNNNNESNE